MFSKIKTSTSTDDYSLQIKDVRELIVSVECVIIGAGAGLSTAAGLRYDGPDFEREFADFIKNYGITDLYSSSFYPFETEEEYWACWARHIHFIRFHEAAPLYQKLYELVKDKEHFVITTNVDGQFLKAGFSADQLFEVQGDYAYLQCAKGCHDKLYNNEHLIKKMVAEAKNCRIPSSLIPRCPVCGEKMSVHVRCDQFFVENEAWHSAANRYYDFLEKTRDKNTVLLELGVGFNTPTIIRFPFERMVSAWKKTSLVRINKDNVQSMFASKRITAIKDDISTVLNVIRSF